MVLTVALAVCSCNRKTVYDHYEHTPSSGWERNDTLNFHVSQLSTTGTFREEIGLRINGAYPFMSLCLIVDQTLLPANIVRSDTLNCRLADDNGNTRGHGIGYYQYNFHLNTQQLSKGDSLHITIRHNMKREILPGIADVGVRLSHE